MDTIVKGRIGYNLVEKQLLKNEWDIYTPVLENTKIDCIIVKNNYLYKIQIKTIGFNARDNYKYIPVRKISHNQGQYKIHTYENDVDYFIGVDIDTEDVYIVPISFIAKYKSSISINKLTEFKNNFTQLERQIGNDLNECDDIGETLTGNTEGMNNQPVESR